MLDRLASSGAYLKQLFGLTLRSTKEINLQKRSI
jgi:hypothetical protein